LAAGSVGPLGCGGSTQASSQDSHRGASQAQELPAASPPADPLSAAKLPLARPQEDKPLPEKPLAGKVSATKAPRIALGELAGRRDLWPLKVKLTKKAGFGPGEIYEAGLELDLYDISGQDLQLDTGEMIIEVPSDSTDVLERASDLVASLSPEQLALTPTALSRRPELWPVELKVAKTLNFGNGAKVPAGRTVYLRTFEGENLNLYDREVKNYFQAAVNETDVMPRARERMKLPEAERVPFFVRSVGAALETGGGPDALAKSEFVLVYQVKLGCGRCAMFLPELAKFYERIHAAHPEFEAVFVSADTSAENMRKLAKEEKLTGRAVAYDKRLEAATLGTLTQGGETLPLVYLYDRSGKLVARNQPNGGKPSGEDVLAMLEKKLGEKR